MAESTKSGLGRVLVAIYAVFALSATRALRRPAGHRRPRMRRSPTRSPRWPRLVYIAATLGLAEVGPAPRRLAWAAVGFELVGVLTVGTLTVLDPELFPDATVWSAYGQGYGYLPLVLPFLGLAWLVRTRPTA